MNKNKIIVIVFLFMFVLSSVSNVCFAELGNGFDESKIANSGGKNPFESPIQKVWGSILLVMQVVSAGGVVFMGVRYMFASASEKASIKSTTIYGIIGIAMVFAVSTVIKYLIETVNNVL